MQKLLSPKAPTPPLGPVSPPVPTPPSHSQGSIGGSPHLIQYQIGGLGLDIAGPKEQSPNLWLIRYRSQEVIQSGFEIIY